MAKKKETANSRAPEDIEYAKRIDMHIPEAQGIANIQAAVYVRSLLAPHAKTDLSKQSLRQLLGVLKEDYPELWLAHRSNYGAIWDKCFHTKINELTREAGLRSL
jgi:hypothetical protein